MYLINMDCTCSVHTAIGDLLVQALVAEAVDRQLHLSTACPSDIFAKAESELYF